MNKNYKLILTSLLVLILTGIGGATYYFVEIKKYEVADAEVDEILNDEYQITLPEEVSTPLNTSANNAGNGEILNNPSSTKATYSVINKENTNEQAPETQGHNSASVKKANDSSESTVQSYESNSPPIKEISKNTDSKKTNNKRKEPQVQVSQIKEKYRPTFQSLESQANARIDALLGRAISEYRTKQANGESISIGYFYQKYSSSGRALESQTDATFEYVYGALKKDLKKHGFSTAHAQSFRQEYENSKKARESALLNMAKSAL